MHPLLLGEPTCFVVCVFAFVGCTGMIFLLLLVIQFKPDPRFEEAKQFIRSGAFGSYDYNPLLDSLEGNSGYGCGDYFLVGQDFPSYMDAQERVDEAYK